MAIKKTGETRYRVDVAHQGRRVRLDLNCQSDGPAKWAERKMKDLLKKGLEIDKVIIKREALKQFGEDDQSEDLGVTLQDLYRHCLRYHWRGQKSERTADINAYTCVELIGHHKKIVQIDRHTIDRFVESLKKKGSSNATINRKLAALSTMLEHATDRGWIKAKPKFPKRLKENKHRIRCISDQEEDQIRKYCEAWGAEDLKDLILVMMYTGARRAEAIKLKAQDVDDNYVHFRDPKNSEDRSVALCETARAILHKRVEGLGSGDLVFADLTYEKLRHLWSRLKLVMKLEDDPQFTPHVLRHTFASRLAQRGAKLQVIRELMGHQDIQTTMRYVHFMRGHLDEAVNLLDGDH